ncbi:MAG: DUF2207 domain-containing protein [Lacibacter sp.]
MKKFLLQLLCFSAISFAVNAQGGFTIKQYHVDVLVNKDASLDITETINVNFFESHHGIFRIIPYKYKIETLPAGTEKADRQLESNGYAKTIIENIDVPGWKYSVSNKGGYKEIKIGDKDKYVEGDQQYIIHYRMLNAINFFKDKSELYLNIIGDRWDTTIDSVSFSITLYDAVPATPFYFVATGITGSRENTTVSSWSDNKFFAGHTTAQLQPNEGVTVGIVLPPAFLIKQNFMLRGMAWLLLPAIVSLLMFYVWRKWGKDETLTITTEFYPPENISPSVAGYIIDDILDKRELTALIPYWGAAGYLQVKETEKKSLMGLIKDTEYEFIKLKELPASAMTFERTFFNGIFESRSSVELSSLKNVLYKTMDAAKKELESEVDRSAYYVKYSRGFAYFFIFLGLAISAAGIFHLVKYWGDPFWLALSLIISGISIIIFGSFMIKKTPKGNDLYKKLAGFKEFIKTVEKDRLAVFLKQDEHYFDKVLPYAIVFNMADKWKDKLKGLDVPPPTWYSGNQTNFNTYMFLNSLDHSMNEMSKTFYSTPSSSGSSGGSFGGGGFSGGGFGGGGGGSW